MPCSISTSSARSAARSRTASASWSGFSGRVTSTLSSRRPRTTSCSTSTTSSVNADRHSNSAVDTPGRSGPVRVSRIVGSVRCGVGTCSVIGSEAIVEDVCTWREGEWMSAAFELAHVTVVRSGKALLNDVSWRAEVGDRWVVIGANGAGKSTLMQILGTTMFPTSGEAEILGDRLGEVDVFDLRTRIGFTGTTVADRIPAEETVLDAVMSAAHAVTGRWNEVYEAQDIVRADQILGELGILALANRTFGTLSEGERKRTLVARALMTDPELLVLDEPGAGLDLGAR